MQINVSAFSNLGPRKVNEDRYLKPEPACGDALLVAIADGMGGAAGGADAASIAIDVARATGPQLEKLEQIFADTVSALRSRAAASPELGRMGTTLSVAVLTAGSVYVAHVGDTRIYHLRGEGLNNLTEDQTEIAELVRRGVFSEREAKRYPRRNVLLSALTTSGEYNIYRKKADLKIGDRIVLLSDGVHQRVMRGGIINSSVAHPSLEDFVSDIEQRDISNKPTDNFTVIAVQIEEL
jgi:protein phosphatase